MSTWDRSIDLFINIGTTPEFVLLLSKTSSEPAARPVLVSGDKHLVRLWFLNATTGTPANLELGLGAAIAIAGKLTASAEATLFSAIDFTAVDDHFEALLELATSELEEALGDETSLLVTIEVQVQNSDNTERRTRQFQARINRGGFDDDSQPVSTEAVQSAFRVKTSAGGSFLQLKNATTGEWHSVFLTGAAPATTLAFGAGEA